MSKRQQIFCPHCGEDLTPPIMPRKRHSDFVARKLGYENISELIRDYRSQGKPYKQIAYETGLSEVTIIRNIPEEIKGDFIAQTEALKIAQSNNGKKVADIRRKKLFDFQMFSWSNENKKGMSPREISLENMKKAKEKLFQERA